MVLMQHRFLVDMPDGSAKKISATMIEYGTPKGDTAMARTVGVPAAVATKHILEGTIKATGVRIPTSASIYEPVLAELNEQGIVFKEEVEQLY